VGELHLIEDVARELPAGAGKSARSPECRVMTFFTQAAAAREAEHQRQDDNDCAKADSG
jgi:hypothetical protein